MPPGRSLSQRRRLLLALAGIAPLTLVRPSAAASRTDIRVIVGPDSQRHSQAVEAIRLRYGPVPVDARPQSLRRATRPTAYVALGAVAFRAAFAAGLDAPVVCLLASRQAYEREASAVSSPQSTAIFGEPSPSQQMRLIAALYRRPVVVGVLISDQTAHMESSLREAANGQGLRLSAARAAPDTGLTRSLNRLGPVDVLLIFPDSNLYTQSSLRELLESTYRRRIPVIGFSAALVAAGTLASAHTDIHDTLVQLDRVLDELVAQRVPSPRYPTYWRVAFNESVARSLDIVIDDAARSLGVRP